MENFKKIFKITIPDNDVEQLQTIGDVESYLKNKLNYVSNIKLKKL